MRYAQLLRNTVRLDEALNEARRAQELDPLALPVKTMVGWVFFNQHRYDEAIGVWDAVLELDPDYGLAIYNKGLAYAMKGLGEDVIAAARRAEGRWRGGRSEVQIMWLRGIGYAVSGQRAGAEAILPQLHLRNPAGVALPSAILRCVLGDEEEALQLLEREYVVRHPALPTVTSEPWFDRLREHPRFRALRAKMGFPDKLETVG
jgi:tetratricopeptide (TPR) repeat protein